MYFWGCKKTVKTFAILKSPVNDIYGGHWLDPILAVHVSLQSKDRKAKGLMR